MTCFGTYISWNFIDSSIPDKSYVLLYAHSDLLGYDVWLNTGTYDCQYNRGSGNLGWYGGTRSDVEKWWIDDTTEFYVKIFDGKMNHPGNQFTNTPILDDSYLIGQSQSYTLEYLKSYGAIGDSNNSIRFVFSNNGSSVPEPSCGLLFIIGMSLLILRRKLHLNKSFIAR